MIALRLKSALTLLLMPQASRVQRTGTAMKLALILLSALLLGGCLSQINKPIRPNDPWRDKAEATSNPMGVY